MLMHINLNVQTLNYNNFNLPLNYQSNQFAASNIKSAKSTPFMPSKSAPWQLLFEPSQTG